MGHFSDNFKKYIGLIHSALIDLKTIHDGGDLTSEDNKYRVQQARKVIIDSFVLIEKIDSRKAMMENKANNVLHDLEEEFKRLNQKFMRLEHFERQMDNHFLVISQSKNEVFEMFEKGRLNQGVIDRIVASMDWLVKEVSEDRKEIFDVETELKNAQERITKLQKHLRRED